MWITATKFIGTVFTKIFEFGSAVTANVLANPICETARFTWYRFFPDKDVIEINDGNEDIAIDLDSRNYDREEPELRKELAGVTAKIWDLDQEIASAQREREGLLRRFNQLNGELIRREKEKENNSKTAA